jgi:hypothetical protein
MLAASFEQQRSSFLSEPTADHQREPSDLEVFRGAFKCPLHFNQQIYALEFDDRALAAAPRSQSR